MRRTTYRDRVGGSAWSRLLLSGRLRGVINVAVGALLVLLVAAPYTAHKLGLLALTDRAVVEEVSQPPAWKFLADWLDRRPETTALLDDESPGASIFRKKKPVESTIVHPFGTDSAGRDILQLIVLAADNAFIPGLYSVLLTIGLGSLFGILWGYYSGWRASLVESIIKIVHSVPRLFLLLVVGAATNFNIYWIMTGLGIINFPKIAELIRGRIVSLQRQEFITAAREVGMRDLTILFKHVLWYNCRHILFIQATFGMADAVLTETTLSYLGFGAQGTSWGRMVASGKDNFFNGMLWMSMLPAMAIVTVILGFCLIGDGLARLFKLKVA